MELEGDIGGFEVMLIAAIVIYVILALLTGPFWPLDYISGKAGCLGQIICLLWGGLLLVFPLDSYEILIVTLYSLAAFVHGRFAYWVLYVCSNNYNHRCSMYHSE